MSSRDIFNKDPISTISGLLAPHINGRRPDATNRPITISYNQHSRLSDPQAVQVALDELDDDRETREGKQAKARNKQIEKRPPSHHRISSSSDQPRPRKILEPRGPSQRLSVANTLSANKVAPPSPAIVAAPIVPISQALFSTAAAPATATPATATPATAAPVTSPAYAPTPPTAAKVSRQVKAAENHAKNQKKFQKMKKQK